MAIDWKFTTKAALLFLLSLLAISYGCSVDRASKLSQGWPATTGKILGSEVKEEHHYVGPGSSSVNFRAWIRYEYQVDGHTYTSDKFSYSGSRSKSGKRGKRLATELAAEYHPGRTVEVFYNPAAPWQACLKPGRTSDGTVLIILGSLGLLWFVVYVGGHFLDRSLGLRDGPLARKTGGGEGQLEPTGDANGRPVLPVSWQETIPSPTAAYPVLVTIALTLFWFGLPLVVRLFIFPDSLAPQQVPGYLAYLLTNPPLHWLLPLAAITTIGVFAFNRAKIRIHAGVLHLPPRSRYQPRNIASEDIVHCAPREYAYPFWQLLLPRPRGVFGAEIVKVLGYRGPGLIVSYHPEKYGYGRLASILTDSSPVEEKEVVLVHFPCRQPELLCAMLGKNTDPAPPTGEG